MNATTSQSNGTSLFAPTQIPVPPRFKRRRQPKQRQSHQNSQSIQESILFNTASSTVVPISKGSSATRPPSHPHRSASYHPNTPHTSDKSRPIWTKNGDATATRATFEDAKSRKHASLWDEAADLQEIVHRNNIHRFTTLLSSIQQAGISRQPARRPLPGPMGRHRAVSSPAAYLSHHSTSSLRLKEPQLPLHIYDTYLPALPESFCQQEPPTIHIFPASHPKPDFPTDALGLDISRLTTLPHPPLPSLDRRSRSNSPDRLQPADLSPAECSPSSGTDSASSFSIPDEDTSEATTPAERDSPDLNSNARTLACIGTDADYEQFPRLPFPSRPRRPAPHRNLVGALRQDPSADVYDEDEDAAEYDSDQDHLIYRESMNRRTTLRPRGGVTRGRGRFPSRSSSQHLASDNPHLTQKYRSFSTGNLPRVPYGEDPLASPSFHALDSDWDETASLPDYDLHRKPSSGSLTSVASSSESFRALFSAAWNSFMGMSTKLVDGYSPSTNIMSPRSSVDSMSMTRESDNTPVLYPASLIDIKPYGYRVEQKDVDQVFGGDNVGEKVDKPVTPEEAKAGGLATILGYLSSLANAEGEVASSAMTGRFGGGSAFSSFDDSEYSTPYHVPHRIPLATPSKRPQSARSASAPPGFSSSPATSQMARSASGTHSLLQSRHSSSNGGASPTRPPVSVALQRYPIIPYNPPQLVDQEVFPKLRDLSKPLWWISMVPGGQDGKIDEEVGRPIYSPYHARAASEHKRQLSQPWVQSRSKRDTIKAPQPSTDPTLGNGSDVTDSEDELSKAIAMDQQRQRGPSPTARLASFSHISKSSDLSSVIASVMRTRQSRSRSNSRSRSREVQRGNRRDSTSPTRTRRTLPRSSASSSLPERGRGRVPRVIEMFEEDDQPSEPVEMKTPPSLVASDSSSANVDAIFPSQFYQSSPSPRPGTQKLGKGVHPSAVFGSEDLAHKNCRHGRQQSRVYSPINLNSAFDYVVSGGGDVRKPNIWLLCAIRGSLRTCAQSSDIEDDVPPWLPMSAPAPSSIFASSARRPLPSQSVGSSAIEAEGLLTHKINSFYSTYGRAASAAAAAAVGGPSTRESRAGDASKRKFGLTRGRSTVPPSSSISCSPVRRSISLSGSPSAMDRSASCYCHRASKLRWQVSDA